jgi:glutamate-ammonia-ligase adenylyltransferase
MTATSDLDLVLLYDFDPEALESSGPRPLPPTTYFGRLTQRLISALTVPTRRGTLYSVDMRLRPTGNKGPAATQFKGFVDYQATEAETWEQMALVRARVLAGDPALIGKVEEAIRTVLQTRRDATKIKSDALEMRRMIAAEKGDDQPWDLKNAAGGLTDLEFLTQTLVLVHAADYPALMQREARAILGAAMQAGLIGANDADQLMAAHAMMRDLFQWVRLTLGDGHAVTSASKGLKRQLAVTAGLPDYNVLSGFLRETQQMVRQLFTKWMA